MKNSFSLRKTYQQRFAISATVSRHWKRLGNIILDSWRVSTCEFGNTHTRPPRRHERKSISPTVLSPFVVVVVVVVVYVPGDSFDGQHSFFRSDFGFLIFKSIRRDARCFFLIFYHYSVFPKRLSITFRYFRNILR